MPKVFISYKHDADPDVRLAEFTLRRLQTAGHDVFIDSQIAVGDEWPKVIEQNVKTSDYLIVFLSAAATTSEMIMKEISIARDVRKDFGRPKILPVRVANEQPLPYELGAWLDQLQQAYWRTDADDSMLLDQLTVAIDGAELPLTAPASAEPLAAAAPLPAFDLRWLDLLDSGTGAVKPASPFYIERDLDAKARHAVTQPGETILIQGSRQSGKSSALARICKHARDNGQATLFVDFQGADKSKLKDFESLLRYLADLISFKLKTPEKPDSYWNSPLGPTDKLSDFLETEVLRRANAPFVLALDEVDRVFEFPHYASQFFGLLRSWHNKRAFDEIWNNLNLVLVYSTESNKLIQDQNQSPFNVGLLLDSSDFTRDQVVELNQRHGSPLSFPGEVNQLMSIVSGHPYLVRKALFEMVKMKRSFAELNSRAASDDGPFADHLKRYVVWLAERPVFKAAFKSSLKSGVCETDLNFFGLRAAGLLRGQSRHAVKPRCGLYGSYFTTRL